MRENGRQCGAVICNRQDATIVGDKITVVLNDVKSMGDYKYYGYDATYRALPEERAVATV